MKASGPKRVAGLGAVNLPLFLVPTLRVGTHAGTLRVSSRDSSTPARPPAPEFGPIPPGKYIAHAVDGALFNAATGTPGYKVTFAILGGEHQSRRVWFDIWLTQKAQSQAVRDFGKLCITSKAQLEQPLPQGIRCEIDVILRANDRGEKYNVVKSFRVIGIDPPEQDAFAPAGPQGR